MGSETTMQQLPGSTGGAVLDAGESLAVIAYRLGQLETVVGKLDNKFDRVADLYVNHASLTLIIAPFKEKIAELEEVNKTREMQKDQAASQLRLAIIVAVMSPIVSAIVTILIGTAVANNG